MSGLGAGHQSSKPHEARVNILSLVKGTMLAHRKTGQASLESYADHELKRHHSDFRWKLEVISKDSDGNPKKVLIRNDWHPQRALTDELALTHSYFSAMGPETEWNVMPVKAGCVSPVYLRHDATGRFLAVNEESGALQMADQQGSTARWSLLPARGSLSPVQTLLGAIFPVAGANQPILTHEVTEVGRSTPYEPVSLVRASVALSCTA